jgi:hypothetical protein
VEHSDNNEGSIEGDANAEDKVDEAFDSLIDKECEQLLKNTSAICTILDKVWFVLVTWITAITN